MVGNIYDDAFGTMRASSFFRVLLPTKVTTGTGTHTYGIDENAVFDSLCLYIVYNKYYEGDTTLPFTINLHRLSDELKPNTDGFFYNNDSIPAYPDPIGSAVIRPSPNSGDSAWITIDRDLGEYLFERMKENERDLLENNLFQEFFKGFMITGDAGNNAMVGFNFPGSESATNFPAMRIYYHYFQYATIHKRFDFSAQATILFGLGKTQLQFNRFTLSNRKVAFPADQDIKLPVSLTGKRSYVLSGLGVVTRLEIPYIKNLYYISDDIRILDAQLELEPASGTYTEETLPAEINLHTSDNKNQWGSLLYNKTNTQTIADLKIDMLYQENTRYTFDITNFLISRLQSQTDVIPAALLSVSGENFYKTGKRVVLGSQHHSENKIKLKVYYMNVN